MGCLCRFKHQRHASKVPDAAIRGSDAVLPGNNRDGKVDNPGLSDYRMPVSSDLPMLDTVMVEVPNPKHPQGVKGVGKVPLVPVMAAVANAIHNALGKRFYSLPMSPPSVLAALEGAE